jgi:hypothetical protein
MADVQEGGRPGLVSATAAHGLGAVVPLVLPSCAQEASYMRDRSSRAFPGKS